MVNLETQVVQVGVIFIKSTSQEVIHCQAIAIKSNQNDKAQDT
jgi:hypothetical protein